MNLLRILLCFIAISINSVSALACEEDSNFDLEKYTQELFAMMDEDEASSIKISESSPTVSQVESTEEKTPVPCQEECAEICSEIALAPVQPTGAIHFNIKHIHNVVNFNVVILNSAALQAKPYGTHPNYKTELCDNWKKTGKCNYGKSCQFAHGKEEKVEKKASYNYKTEKCKNYWGNGKCNYGDCCRFIH